MQHITEALPEKNSFRLRAERMNGSTTVTPVDRFGLTLFVAVALHAVVILGISFSLDEPKRPANPDRTLEIMVLQQPKKTEAPKKADYLAQITHAGGGNQEKKARPTTVAPSPKPAPKQIPAPQNRPVKQPAPIPPKKVKKVLSQKSPAKKRVVTKPKTPPKKPLKKRVTAAQLLASANPEIARLTAEIARKERAYAKRPRKKFISASTKEHKYASYLDSWRRKVESVGNLNYPDEARRKKLYGNLVLEVSIRQGGDVSEIAVRRSSGHKLLDDAAIRIVKQSAPFAPFPAEIREETEIIVITRTWQFLKSNRLFAK
ncbi:MAG: energy transducer TonB [Candidatus Sedimenticola sp. (ex Thyasira tokunagai)]